MKLFPARLLVAAAATVSPCQTEALGKARTAWRHAVDKAGRPGLPSRRQVRRPEGRCRQARAEGDQGRSGRLGPDPDARQRAGQRCRGQVGRLDPDPQAILPRRTKPAPRPSPLALDPGAGAAWRLTNLRRRREAFAVTLARIGRRSNSPSLPRRTNCIAPARPGPGSRCRRSSRCWPRACWRARLRPGSAVSIAWR